MKIGLRHVLSWPKLGLEPKFHESGTFGGFGKRGQSLSRIFNTGPYGDPPLKIKILKIGLRSDLSWPKVGLEPTRVEEDSYTLSRLEEKGVGRGDGRQGELHGPVKRRANQLLMETISIHTLRWTLQRRGVSAWTRSEDDDP